MPSAGLSRDEQLRRLERESFDLAIIGGGINGAAIAREAAVRGLKVALCERGDFAGQTSSHSSKLIHGGLRYLPQGQLRLVYQALRERERLRRHTAPHLVHGMRFLVPLFSGRGFSRWSLGLGLCAYDLFARVPHAERHRMLSRAQLLAAEPELRAEGLLSGASYEDGHADDARLTLENVLDAALHGAAVANYVALDGFGQSAGALGAAEVHDVLGGRAFSVRARRLVNATGPWLDKVRRLDRADAAPAVRLTKGVHLVFRPEELCARNSLVLADGWGRVVFVIRTESSVLVGTTDTDFQAEPEAVGIERADVEYLMDVLGSALPALGRRARPAVGFSGLRSLVLGGRSRAPSRVSREELVLESSSGLLSIAGGKLTTHRHIAERLLDEFGPALGAGASHPTRTLPLPGARAEFDPDGDAGRRWPELWSRYGSRSKLVAALIEQDPALAQPLVPGCPVVAAEVLHAVRHELAVRLGDFMLRRACFTWRFPWYTAAAGRRAAELMQRELGWSMQRREDEVAALEVLPLPGFGPD